MSHGKNPDTSIAAAIGLAAQAALYELEDSDRQQLYYDLILNSLSEAAYQALQNMDPANYQYQSKFARKFYGQGKAEGTAEGEAKIVLRLLALRYGPLSDSVQLQIRSLSTQQLEALAARLLTAQTLSEALGNGAL